MTPGPLALLGSGEFEPWSRKVDRWLLESASGDGTVLILPAASAPEGDGVFHRWAEMALRHYRAMGVPAEVVPIKTVEDAGRPELAARTAGASIAYFSGGNPAYLARVLAGSEFWRALLGAMERGLAYAGCSAGIACLGETALDSAASVRARRMVTGPGLRLFPGTHLAPHWNAIDRFAPGLSQAIVRGLRPGERLLAVDERTAVAGDGSAWTVIGAGGAHLLHDGQWSEVAAGRSFFAPLLAPEPVADSRGPD